jgi:hypothetical protein
MDESADRLEAAFDVYRTLEPVRVRDPFADPRLAAIAAERARRATTPWYRRIALAPAPVFAGATLALVLALAPAGLPLTEQARTTGILASPALDAVPLPADAATPLAGAAPEHAAETPRLLLLGLAGALAGLGLRRLARRS